MSCVLNPAECRMAGKVLKLSSFVYVDFELVAAQVGRSLCVPSSMAYCESGRTFVSCSFTLRSVALSLFVSLILMETKYLELLLLIWPAYGKSYLL